MTVYNRKMFRKKGGGATGIMASGPELIKAQSGVSVNIPGGGSTLQRSGFPGLRAFGGLGQTIPSQFQMPTLEDIIGAGGQPTNTRARGNISARGVNATSKFTPPSLMQRLNRVPDGIQTIPSYGRNAFLRNVFPGAPGTGYSKIESDAVRDIASQEADVIKELQNKGIDTGGPKTQKEIEEAKAIANRKAGLGDEINASIQKTQELAKIDETPFDLEGEEAFDDSTNIKTETTKKVEAPVIGGGDNKTKPNNVSEIDTMITSVFGKDKTKDTTKGSGAETKGSGKASAASESTKNAYKKTNDLIKNYVEKGDSENATNTQLMQAGFTKTDVENMSPAEKVAEVKNIITEVMGSRDSGPDDDLSAMNTIMLGLSIAAGDSPDALTNIIKGSKDYTERRVKQLKEKRDREEKLDMLALTTVLNREDKEDDRNFRRELNQSSQKHDMRMFSIKSTFEMEKQLATFNFKERINKTNNLLKLKLDDSATERHAKGLKTTIATVIAKIKSNEAIANASNALKADIANANNENQLLRTTLSNLPEGYAFAMQEGMKLGKKGDDLLAYAKEKGQLFAKNNIFTGPDSIRRMVINVAPKVMKEQDMNFSEAVDHIVESISGNETLSKAFPEINTFQKNVASPTTATINANQSKILDQRNIKVGDTFDSGGVKYKRTADNKLEVIGG